MIALTRSTPVILTLLAVATMASSCVPLPNAPKYDTSGGLDVAATAIGDQGSTLTGPRAARASRAAGLLGALAGWCEEFDELDGEVQSSDRDIPIELYDPEHPPENIDNLEAFKDSFSNARAMLELEVSDTDQDSGADSGRVVEIRCSLRPGVDFHYTGEWDSFEVQTRDVAELEITKTSGYFQPTTLRAEGGVLVQPLEGLIPLEYIEGLLKGQGIRVNVSPRQNGAQSVTLTRRFREGS